MRSYIVIPAGTPLLRVQASTPHFASSKAKHGRDVEHVATDEMVLAESRTIEPHGLIAALPGQLVFANGPEAV
jgi:hypothetical protein